MNSNFVINNFINNLLITADYHQQISRVRSALGVEISYFDQPFNNRNQSARPFS